MRPIRPLLQSTWRFFCPPNREARDPGFQTALERSLHLGLTIAGVLAVVAAVGFVVGKLVLVGGGLRWAPFQPLSHAGIFVPDKLVTVAVGGLAVWAGAKKVSLFRGRAIGAALGVILGAATLYSDALHGTTSLGYLATAFATVVVLIPFRPGQTFGIGLAFILLQVGATQFLRPALGLVAPASGLMGQPMQLGIMTLLMTGVSAALYRSRYRQYRARREAEELRDEVAELEAAKSRFFANVSHELRTPLTVILGPLEDALDGQYGDLPARLRERLGAMKGQAERLQTLVDQLLRLSELDEGRMDLDARPIRLDHFLRRMVSLFRSMADRQGVEVRMEAEEDPRACADPEALRQILSNLLSNALEHTPEGGTVRLRARRRSASSAEAAVEGDADWVAISVRDSGPGLPKAVRDELFERYVGAGAETTEAVDVSTGIGLALVKELAERHGGAVAADSEPGFGTEITVWLPARCAALPDEDVETEDESADAVPSAGPIVEPSAQRRPDPSPAAPAVPDDDGGGRPPGGDAPQVLVVDDEQEVRTYLRDVLEPRYAVHTAVDGDDALDTAREQRPDLVISDVVMPRRDGYALCRALRADERLRAVPIILLTVQDEQEDRLEGLREGADAYLGKPFHPEELRQRVENLIGIRRYLRAQDERAAPGKSERDAGAEESEPEQTPSESEFLREVRAVVEEHVANSSFGVDWLADEMDLSTRQLQRRLQDEAGLSAAAFIRAIRLDRAADLLDRGEVTTVTDAADAVGYRDASYFSQLFKEAHGRSPSALKG